jgi:RNA polymerase sigma-70 factor (ECF subfamily)
VCNEEHLLTNARQFEPAALAKIHDRYYEAIYRYAHYRTGDAQLAEDAASEVFVRLLDALQNGKAPRQSLRGWLFGTASNIVNDHFRRHYRSQTEDLDGHSELPASADADPEHQLQVSQNHDRLRNALTHLTNDQQHVIALRFGQGMSHREVAELLGKSEGAVKLLQFRALRALRHILEPKPA